MLFWNEATVVPAATLIPVLLFNIAEFDSRITAEPLNPETPVPLLVTIVLSTFITEANSATMPMPVLCDTTESLIDVLPDSVSSPNWHDCNLTLSSEAVAVPVLV
jgi:hypothetical protein